MGANTASVLEFPIKLVKVEDDVDMFDLDLRFSPQNSSDLPTLVSSMGEFGPTYCPNCAPTCAGQTTCWGTCSVGC